MNITPALQRQPTLGFWRLGLSILFALLYLRLLAPAFELAHADAAVNYPLAFFFWSFALMTPFELWPFRRLGLPWSGFLSGALAIVLAVLSWILLSSLIAPQNALSVFIYAYFPLCVTTCLAPELVANLQLGQPWKGTLLTLSSLLFGWLVFGVLGAAPQAWVYMIPVFFLVYFDGWPTPADRPVRKLVFWVVIVILIALAIDFLHGLAGHPVTTASGSDAESILWAVMMPVYAFDIYLTRRWEQPRKGITLLLVTYAVTILLNVLHFSVLHMQDWWISTWAFVVWVFLVIIHWMPMPWPED